MRRTLISWLVVGGLVAAACAPAPEGEAPATTAAPATTGAPATTAAAAPAGPVVWFSNQLAPVEEAEKVRSQILAGYEGEVEYVTADNIGIWVDRIEAEAAAGEGTVDLLGGLHGDYTSLGTDFLTDVSDVMGELGDLGFAEQYVELSKLGTDSSFYIPWMQATYIVVANNKAMEFLPEGADVEQLTYDQYLEWAKNIFDSTGQAKVGFPAGEGGLLHRWFQGYLIPAFTGGLVTTFAESDPAWQWMVDIWQYVHPQSVGFEFMQEPLLSEEVWVAWDHVARVRNALEQRPDDFVAVPAPTGPEGLAFMPVLAGLAIPNTAPNPEGAKDLIRYLIQPETQAVTLREVGFFPVVAGELPADVSAGTQAEAQAVSQQAESTQALPALLPVGLGERGGDFNLTVFIDAFQRIVLNGEDIRTVLSQETEDLRTIIEETGAPCWEPDPPSEGQPCPVG